MDIYKSQNFADLLTILIAHCHRGGRGNYAILGRKLGLRSPRTLAMVVKKQRPPSSGLIKKVIEYLQPSTAEKDFIHILGQISRNELKGGCIEKLLQHHQILVMARSIQIPDRLVLDGVIIEFTPQADPDVRKKIEEVLQVILSLKKPRTDG